MSIVKVAVLRDKGKDLSQPHDPVITVLLVSGITTIVEALVIQNAVISPVLEGYVLPYACLCSSV